MRRTSIEQSEDEPPEETSEETEQKYYLRSMNAFSRLAHMLRKKKGDPLLLKQLPQMASSEVSAK